MDDASADRKFRIMGRLQFDSANFDSQSPMFSDGSDIRRARLALKADLAKDWNAKIEFELSDSKPAIRSAWVRQAIGDESKITIGQFKQPFSLINATSSRYSTFIERALPNVFSPGYQAGVMFTTHDDNWSLASGLSFGEISDEFEFEDDGTAWFVRGVYHPYYSSKSFLHLGVSIDARHYNVQNTLRLRAKPETDLTDIRLVNSSRFSDLDSGIRYAFEFAWKYQSISLQAEYLGQNVALNNSENTDIQLDGWYAQASWLLTGEHRRYNRESGRFINIDPQGRWGALEFAARYSTLDLNNDVALGGVQQNSSIALNWYASDSTRVSLNYIDVQARPSRDGIDEDLWVLLGRVQVLF